MLGYITAIVASIPAATTVQVVQPGGWDVKSTVVELTAPGLPKLIARMVRGKSKTEHKQLAAGQGIEMLLAPDPKAQCHIDAQLVADGRYTQALSCPQKRGQPVHITRAGTYDAAGFVGSATVAGTTAKGSMRIVLNQRASRVGG